MNWWTVDFWTINRIVGAIGFKWYYLILRVTVGMFSHEKLWPNMNEPSWKNEMNSAERMPTRGLSCWSHQTDETPTNQSRPAVDFYPEASGVIPRAGTKHQKCSIRGPPEAPCYIRKPTLKSWQVFSLGDAGLLQSFRVVSSGYGKPRVSTCIFFCRSVEHISNHTLRKDN